MFSDAVEKLKIQYTDKYVAVDASRPELARFRDVVGQVKTVNMSGRALVEFLDYHLNIGWFDIDVSALKIVDKPAAKAAEKKAEPKKPAAAPAAKAAPAGGEKKLSPLEAARAQGVGGAKAPAKPAGEKKSVTDVLAAARGGAAPAAKTEAKSDAKPAAAKPKSTVDILAAARGKAEPPVATTPAPVEAVAAPAASPPAAAKPEVPAPTPPVSAGGVKKVDRASMSVADMIAYCRKSDSK